MDTNRSNGLRREQTAPVLQRRVGAKRRIVVFGIALVVVLAASACGGKSEPSLGELLEASGGDADFGGLDLSDLEGLSDLEDLGIDLSDLEGLSDLEDLGIDLSDLEGLSDLEDLGDLDIDLGDLQLDFDAGSNNVSVSQGGIESAFGTDLERPDWLEPWVQLPQDLSINIAVKDPTTGETFVQGIVANADALAISAQQRAMLEAAGYEALQDSGYFVASGRPSIQIEAYDIGDGTAAYVFQHSFETEQTLRDVYAAVEGPGTLTAWIGNEVLTFDGQCTVRSTSGDFWADDGGASLSVEERDGETNYILGNITNFEDDTFESWSVLQVGPNGEEPAISVRPDSFQFDGFMVGVISTDPEGATLEVKCDG